MKVAKLKKRGLFITFEGGDGVGKSTQVALLSAALKKLGHQVLVTREPGGTKVGEILRKLMKAESMNAITELMILEASRAEHVEKVLKPSLASGKIVLCDRYEESGLVYQGYVRGLPLKDVKEANRIATQGLHADLVILLDSKSKNLKKRLEVKSKKDRLDQESEVFHRKVREAFRKVASGDRRFKIYDAHLDRNVLHQLILKDIQSAVKKYA